MSGLPTIVSNWDALRLALLDNFGIVVHNTGTKYGIPKYYLVELYGSPTKPIADALNSHPMLSKIRVARFLQVQGYIEFNESTEEWRIIPSDHERDNTESSSTGDAEGRAEGERVAEDDTQQGRA